MKKVWSLITRIYYQFSVFRFGNIFGLLSRKSPKSHPIISISEVNGHKLFTICPTLKVQVFKNEIDNGYHKFSNAWWYNINCPYSFNYLDIDSLYPEIYFQNDDTGHPNQLISQSLYEYMQKVYQDITGKKFKSILELGTGGGEITVQFVKDNLDVFAVEGSESGINKLYSLGVSPEKVLKCDLRLMKSLDREFDLVMCTEVIEHIEPFFAAKVVEQCTKHSRYVWFSGADRNRIPHWHHINEIGIEAWDNLFAFYGFNSFVKLEQGRLRADRLYIKSE
jgi:2-polyprenyl-3-methyl-5-hydroxy-6-metoxy-1,4-benzoquinol methylase